MVQKGLEWDQSHVCWIYNIPLYSVSGKWYVLKYADLGFKKKIHEEVPEWPETINKENATCKLNLIPILLSWLEESCFSRRKTIFPEVRIS